VSAQPPNSEESIKVRLAPHADTHEERSISLNPSEISAIPEVLEDTIVDMYSKEGDSPVEKSDPVSAQPPNSEESIKVRLARLARLWELREAAIHEECTIAVNPSEISARQEAPEDTIVDMNSKLGDSAVEESDPVASQPQNREESIKDRLARLSRLQELKDARVEESTAALNPSEISARPEALEDTLVDMKSKDGDPPVEESDLAAGQPQNHQESIKDRLARLARLRSTKSLKDGDSNHDLTRRSSATKSLKEDQTAYRRSSSSRSLKDNNETDDQAKRRRSSSKCLGDDQGHQKTKRRSSTNGVEDDKR